MSPWPETTPVHDAVRAGDLPRVLELVRHGADVNAMTRDVESALSLACRKGNAQIARALVEAGAWPELEDAISSGSMDLVNLMLSLGAPINAPLSEEGTTPLMAAAAMGHVEIVKALVERGADVNASDREGDSPLSIAAYNGHQNVVDYLLPLSGAEVRERAGL